MMRWYYILAAVTLIVSPFVSSFMSRQTPIYRVYVGAPFSMVIVFGIYGWMVEKYSKKRWGTMKWKGYALLIGGLIALTFLVRSMGFKLLF